MSKGTGLLKEFRDFIMRGNVVDLAVAVVLGAAFGAVVAAFVENLLTPLIAAIFGEPDFSRLTFTVNGSVFRYGAFINAVITFALIALAVYFLVVRPYNAYRARKQAEEPGEPTDEVRLLTEIRDLLEKP